MAREAYKLSARALAASKRTAILKDLQNFQKIIPNDYHFSWLQLNYSSLNTKENVHCMRWSETKFETLLLETSIIQLQILLVPK